MNRPRSSVTGKPIGENTVKARNDYLISYNAVSAILWSCVLSLVLGTAATKGIDQVFDYAADFTRMVQSLAVLEIIHSAAGLVRSPILTTTMQVASRFLLVWFIAYTFPATTSASPAYTTMLLAWSVTEIIRYTYFALNLKNGEVPEYLTWLRYNMFFVLYPVGIASECWLVFKATGPAAQWHWSIETLLWLTLACYVPGAYILFTHMMEQRQKVMRGQKARKRL